MTRRDDFMDPDYEPGEFDLVERELRRALHQEAQLMEPTDRLEDILAAAADDPDHAGRSGGPAGRRWLMPVAAAAAVAALAGGLYLGTRGDDPRPSPAATATPSPATTASPSPTEPTPSATSTPPASSATTRAPGTQAALLPVYYVGPVGGERQVFRLYREFLRGTAAATAGDEERAMAALELAVAPQRSPAAGYLQPWSGTSVEAVSVTPTLITITLSNPGSPAVTDQDVRRVAVQQLVWTAQAAVGKGTIPVRFDVADGSTALFGALPTTDTYNRPPSREEYYNDLAPIWVTAPSPGQELPAGTPVTVKGEATVFEATVGWQLRRGGTEVKAGFATASEGAPGRGAYSFSLGALTPGDYTVRVFERSMEDGNKVNAQRSVAFTVR